MKQCQNTNCNDLFYGADCPKCGTTGKEIADSKWGAQAYFGCAFCLFMLFLFGFIIYKIFSPSVADPAPLENQNVPHLTETAKMDAVIKAHKIVEGMSPEQVTSSWGKPSRINSTGGQFGQTEQWVYRNSGEIGVSSYLYFDNGKLTSWQTSREP